jgi:hypothetical protein
MQIDASENKPRRKRKAGPPCDHCKLNPMHAHGLCTVCLKYQLRTGQPRPRALIQSVAKRRAAPAVCLHCLIEAKPLIKRLCLTCYQYWFRTGRRRPRRLIDVDYCCLTCGKPWQAAPRYNNGKHSFTKGRCRACYCYWKRHDRERPRHLWGRGPCGWCACGKPAARMRSGRALCDSCLEVKL